MSCWYLQSTGDHDTHRGELHPDGSVVTQCGIRFPPLPVAFGRRALSGEPPDPDQICATCKGSP